MMTIKHRLQKLEQRAAQSCPSCGHAYEESGTMSEAGRKEQIIQRLLAKGYSPDDAQEMYAEALKRAREYDR
jgi:SOS response regulatory protein OraA/RecX